MKNEKKKTAAKKTSKATPRADRHETETMSQQQNRYGKGRAQNGSDGTGNSGRGSNH